MLRLLFVLSAMLGFIGALAFAEGGSDWAARAFPSEYVPAAVVLGSGILFIGAGIAFRKEWRRLGRTICNEVIAINQEVQYREEEFAREVGRRRRDAAIESQNPEMVFCVYRL